MSRFQFWFILGLLFIPPLLWSFGFGLWEYGRAASLAEAIGGSLVLLAVTTVPWMAIISSGLKDE